MDIGQALNLWASCDGEHDCNRCPLHNGDPDVYSVCDLFNEAHLTLEAQGTAPIMLVHLN